jgi:cell shape-determining protein MreC
VSAFAKSPWLIAAGACLTGVALWHAPTGMTQGVHGAAYDALRPGCQMSNLAAQQWQSWRETWADAEAQRLRAEFAESQAALRRQTERVQQLSAQWASSRELPAAVATVPESERLFIPALIEAAVLGETLSQDWREGRVLDRGWKHGVRESALVLQGRGPLIDLGATAQVTPEDPLLVGRTIIGKVAVVGRWTSSYLPVTDADFRGRAQLVRDTGDGPVWGAQGLLRGDSAGRCILEGVPVEEAVRVGDLVFSADRDGALSEPLAYGRVVDVKTSADEREWSLLVEPAPQPSRLTRVHVLRAALNPSRFWTN